MKTTLLCFPSKIPQTCEDSHLTPSWGHSMGLSVISIWQMTATEPQPLGGSQLINLLLLLMTLT